MTNVIPFSCDEEKIVRKLVTDHIRKERMRLVREQVCFSIVHSSFVLKTKSFEKASLSEFEDNRSVAMNGRRISDIQNTLETHLTALSSLLKIRNQVQFDIESSENAGKRVASLQRTREEEKSRSVHDFNKTQIERFREALHQSRHPDSNSSVDNLNRIITLEKAKDLAQSLSRKYRSQETSPCTITSRPPPGPAKPKLLQSDPSTAASSRTSLSASHDRQRSKIRRPQKSKRSPQTDSVTPSEEPAKEFKYINIPDRFHILWEDQENIRDFVNRVAKDNDDGPTEQLSDLRRSIQDMKDDQTVSSVTFSERRDPSRAIERRRAALAALRLRYPKN